MKGKNSKGEKRRYFIQDWRERERKGIVHIFTRVLLIQSRNTIKIGES